MPSPEPVDSIVVHAKETKTHRGVVLAGGTGSRLFPLTLTTNKHLLPVYDKPMIYYPIATLMLGGIREIAIVTRPEDRPSFEALLGTGERLGVRFAYVEQPRVAGIANGLACARDFVGDRATALVLGDSLFWGYLDFLRDALIHPDRATVFAYPVQNPSAYGIVELGEGDRPLSISEKPASPKSQLAVPGIYVLPKGACERAATIAPSSRGEAEITSLLAGYLSEGALHVERLGRGMAWLDMGTPSSMAKASHFVETIESRQGLSLGCLEEVAVRMGFVDKTAMRKTIASYPDGGYKRGIEAVLDE